jgi:phosphoenolpyruvate carboxykinase (ATP)
MDEASRELDFTDAIKTENTRGAYPIEFIPNTSEMNLGPAPSNVIMLTADAFGVLPPIARLTADQAMYYFLSGYTAKVAGTEIGVTEPEATFSTCFGAAFMPRHPSVYGNLLKKRIAEGGAQCWLVNTGWSGGRATDPGIKRMPIKATRALLNAALDGSLNNAEFKKDPNFGFEVPVAVPGVDSKLLDPREAWADPAEYDRTAKELVGKFVANFAQFAEYVDQGVLESAPKAA